jgi:hypothetical protein
MQLIWRIVAEILTESGDLQSGFTKAFVNVITWADSPESANKKFGDYIKRFNWHIITVEFSQPIIEGGEYSEEMEGMIESTRENPNAIILGTFFTYKEN